MKSIFNLILILLSISVFAQSKKSVPKKTVKKTIVKPKPDLEKLNEALPELIPRKVDGKLGYINQKGKFIIQPEYKFGTFFWEDCNLLNSPNEKIQKFGTADFASVTIGENDYRIDKTGKKVYTFNQEDFGKCPITYKEPVFRSYILRGFYGIVEPAKFTNEEDSKQYQIYPQYQYLLVMESEDPKNPMIIASVNDRFGVIDIYNRIIIPFEYTDIKRNYSWKMAKMFEVTRDDKNYFFVDEKNNAY